jgi:hypothetical protein
MIIALLWYGSWGLMVPASWADPALVKCLKSAQRHKQHAIEKNRFSDEEESNACTASLFALMLLGICDHHLLLAARGKSQ